jgi:hypothetical protein
VRELDVERRRIDGRAHAGERRAVCRTVAARKSASSGRWRATSTELGARQVFPREIEPGFGERHVGARVRQDGIVGARVDHEEEIAGLDDGAVGEVDRL